ncbi:unnamed protein product [Orchesella dallaii]|uniref:Uncharacterized protein n=1 Tax=Orchesella dallaii TaxID=48710 RepID=A0ABP1QYF8_9HEXA
MDFLKLLTFVQFTCVNVMAVEIHKFSQSLIVDSNILLNPFSNCLLHLTTYDFHWKQETSSHSIIDRNKYSEDFAPFSQPIIISKFISRLKYSISSHIKPSRKQRISPNSNYSLKGFVFSPRIHNKPCVVQLYILLNITKLPKDFQQGFKFSYEDHHDLILTMQYPAKERITTIPYRLLKRGVYGILLSDDPGNFLQRWFLYKNFGRNFSDRLEIANFFTVIMAKFSLITRKIEHLFFLYHSNRYFPDQFQWLYLANASLLSQLDAIGSLQKHIDMTLATAFEKKSSTWAVFSMNILLSTFNELLENMSGATNGFTRKLGFRNFMSWMLSDVFLFHVAFPNCTISKNIMTAQSAGVIQIDSASALYFVEEKAIEFLTCGGSEVAFVSLIGYVSAFHQTIWIWSIILSLGTICFVFIILKFKPITSNTSNSYTMNAIFFPMDTFLEQGNPIYDKAIYHPWMFLVSATWMLVGIVLSNAYRGDNICELTAPISPTKPTTFEQLVDKNFIITHSDGEAASGIMSGAPEGSNFIRKLYRQNDTNKLYFPSMLSSILRDQYEAYSIVKKYNRVIGIVKNFTLHESFMLAKQGVLGFVNMIKNCSLIAFMSWSDEIVQAKMLFENILYSDGRHDDIKFVSRSKEALLVARFGWSVGPVSYPTTKLERNLAIILESGIQKQWKTVEKFVKSFNATAQVHSRSRVPVALSLKGNIPVVFFLHVVFLSFSTVTFFLEQDSTLWLFENLMQGIVRKFQKLSL